LQQKVCFGLEKKKKKEVKKEKMENTTPNKGRFPVLVLCVGKINSCKIVVGIL